MRTLTWVVLPWAAAVCTIAVLAVTIFNLARSYRRDKK